MADDEAVGTSYRRRLLERAGAGGAVADELLRFGAPLLTRDAAAATDPVRLPDEAQLSAWIRYGKVAEEAGAFEALASVFPQLRYPVRLGMSGRDGYRAAALRGAPPELDPEATGLGVARPDLIRLEIHPTVAGRIPLIVAGDRGDFERLVRALSARNEPVDLPPSMGACLVRGLNDWDRVRTFRSAWEEANPDRPWDEGFQTLVPQKDLYQDRFIILSAGPYSGVEAALAGFPPAEWASLSLAIRREHESTHYLALRATGIVRDSLVDELTADYVGLVSAFGAYRPDLALLFLGLESFPSYREGGRLQNYLGKPPISEGAFEVVKRLVHAAVGNLARFDAAHPPSSRSGPGLARVALALHAFGLEELATEELTSLHGER